jgi:DNA repair protein RadA/Sms
MGKKKVIFSCSSCGHQSGQWLGKCPGCQAWNSFEEDIERYSSQKKISVSSIKPTALKNVSEEKSIRIKSGIKELDRVLGGGIYPSSLILVGGEPGIGKSTLLLSLCGSLLKDNSNQKILYVSGEESVEQIAGRARRMKMDLDNLFLINYNVWEDVKNHLDSENYQYLIIDSIQTLVSENIPSTPGTVSQIRGITFELMEYSKKNNLTTFIVGHVTKEGNIAGPKILEHMVDTVVYFEGDRSGQYRLLRAIKNRYGNTNEVGIFEMAEEGLREVNNPSQYFVENPIEDALGRSLGMIIEGSRPLVVEVQALVTNNNHGNGRRNAQGIDNNRLSMIIAVLEKYLDINLNFQDIYVNVIGGLKVKTGELDLPIAVSILSSYLKKVILPDHVFLGELGLTGEIRTLFGMEQRLNELSSLRYPKAYVSSHAINKKIKNLKIQLVPLKKVADLSGVFGD